MGREAILGSISWVCISCSIVPLVRLGTVVYFLYTVYHKGMKTSSFTVYESNRVLTTGPKQLDNILVAYLLFEALGHLRGDYCWSKFKPRDGNCLQRCYSIRNNKSKIWLVLAVYQANIATLTISTLVSIWKMMQITLGTSPKSLGLKHLWIISSSKTWNSLLRFSHLGRRLSGIDSSQSTFPRQSSWRICFQNKNNRGC